MRALDRKLLRDLGALKGQAAAIAVVIAAGVMTLIVTVTTVDSIRLSQERFYQDFQFADIFADLKRAPDRIAERAAGITGVNLVETRVQAPVRLEVPGFADPVRGRLISIPDGRQPNINRLYVREGTLPESGRSDRVAVSEPFAQAHGLRPGDRLTAIVNGRLETLTISGVVLSPEFVYQLGPADLMPDYERFGVLWMNRRALGNAFDMDGAFNSLVLTLQSGAAQASVIDALDALLAPYGGVGAYSRDDQVSHRILSQEIEQLEVTAIILPAIFLGVSGFLLSVLMSRIIRTQRQVIAVLKAFGYGSGDIARHYGLLTGGMVLGGSLLGVAAGAWAADGLAQVYMEYFRFPELSFRLQPRVVTLGVAVAGGAAMLGTFRAVYGAVSLAPAIAMRPPAPETFRGSRLTDSRLGRLLGHATRIILRNLARHPLKAGLSILGIALSAALMLVGSFQFNAIDRLIDTQYRLVMKMDLIVHFTEPTPERAAAELRQYPGVRHVETFRSVPVRLVNGRRDYRTALQGMDAAPGLRALIDADHRHIVLPAEGLVLTDYLADHLGLKPGDPVRVEIMEGHRRTVSAPLAGTVSEPLGVSAYMERRALNRLMREGAAVSGAWLLADAHSRDALFSRLWDLPRVAGVGLISESEENIRAYIEDTTLIAMGIMLILAASIAFAVVYNNARIAFAERERELATLRVLGFTRTEVAWILVGEIGLLTLAAIPAGWLIGTSFAWLLTEAIAIDMFRVPFIITHQTYAFAAAGVLGASVVSVLLIARRLHRLDMVSALKTVE
jgi:putative ABC transport system permease protein